MVTPFLKPLPLRKGDTIAIIAPAAALAAFVPHRLTKAQALFEASGYNVKVFASVTQTPQENMTQLLSTHPTPFDPALYSEAYPAYCSADAITRAQDLMDAFQDPGVRAIVCAIGGWGSHELLELLDFDVIRANPTIFCGFSGMTSLHCALQAKAGIVSFYGPSAVCQFGEFPEPLVYTMEHFWKAVTKTDAIGEVMPSQEWSDDKTANWFTQADITYVNKMKSNAGYEWLRDGAASGVLLGGCLPVLLTVRGTQFMPDITDAILLLETPESDFEFDKGMPLDSINMVLGALRIDGTFSNIKGLVVGRVFGHSDENANEIKRLIKYHTRGTTFPILYGIDTGHSDPILTLPLGCHVTLDSYANRFCIDDAGVQE